MLVKSTVGHTGQQRSGTSVLEVALAFCALHWFLNASSVIPMDFFLPGFTLWNAFCIPFVGILVRATHRRKVIIDTGESAAYDEKSTECSLPRLETATFPRPITNYPPNALTCHRRTDAEQ